VRGGLALQECRGGRRFLLEVTDSACEEVVHARVVLVRLAGRVWRPGNI
jgi:hypothetical protein